MRRQGIGALLRPVLQVSRPYRLHLTAKERALIVTALDAYRAAIVVAPHWPGIDEDLTLSLKLLRKLTPKEA